MRKVEAPVSKLVNKSMVCLALLTCLFGCKPKEEIRRVVIDADKSAVTIVDQSAKDRMYVAIYQGEASTWTFKVTGRSDAVQKNLDSTNDFLKGVTFDENESPVWELPDRWTKIDVTPGPFAPFARLEIVKGLQMSVSRLPAGMNLLSNINRWHGQLGIPPATSVNLYTLEGGASKFLIFDETGKMGGGGMGGMQPPFANMGGGSSRPPAEKVVAPFEFAKPDSWVEAKNSQMVVARFNKTSDDKELQVTVSRLPANLNTWDQVKMNWGSEAEFKELAPEKVDELVGDMKVDSNDAKLVRFVGDQVETGLIGLRFEKDANAWFVKMKGDKTLVADAETEFFEFVKSIRFKSESP